MEITTMKLCYRPLRFFFIAAICFLAGIFLSADLLSAPRSNRRSSRTKNKDKDKDKDRKNSRSKNDKNAKDKSKEAKIEEEYKGKMLPEELHVPYISTYYIKPIVSTEEEVFIRFYVTDWNQSEYRLMDKSARFTATVTYGAKEVRFKKYKSVTKEDIPAGDQEFSIGKFSPGEYRVAISAVDAKGRRSPVLFHEFLVKDAKDMEIPENKVYQMTAEDLDKWKISNKGDLGSFYWIDTTELDKGMVKQFTEEQAKVTTPEAGRYVVVAGGEKHVDPEPLSERSAGRGARGTVKPEWVPDIWAWRSCTVVYSKSYDKEKVEAAAEENGKNINAFLQDCRKKKYRKVVMLPGTYRISNKTTIEVPDGLTWDLNGATIKLNQFAGCSGMMISIRDCYDTHVVNGIVEGDYFEHDYEHSENSSEWVCGVQIVGDSRYCSFEKLLVRYITGYGVCNGFKDTFGSTKYFSAAGLKPGTIDRKTGALMNADGMMVTDYVDISSFHDSGYVTASRFLGYQGLEGEGWNTRYHFYDKSGKYLETIDGYQYRRVLLPEGAHKMRVTIYMSKKPEELNLTANMFKVPWNSWISDIFVISARCVGIVPAAMYNYKIENCTVVRSGENLAKCAFDAEDGWDMMQDVWIVRNKFYKNWLNELLTCAGHNFIFEDNEAALHLWSRTKGYVCRNNDFKRAYYGAGGRSRTLLPRIDGNTYRGHVQIGDFLKKKPKVDKDLEPPDANAPFTFENVLMEKGWYIVMTDASSAESVKCGDTGMIGNCKLGDMELHNLHVVGCELANDRTVFESDHFVKCKFKAVRGDASGKTTFDTCELTNFVPKVFPFIELEINDSTLENVTVKCEEWSQVSKITFNNCVIKNTKFPVVLLPAYSVGKIRFVNCKIDTGPAGVVEINDFRPQETDKETGHICFESCTVTNEPKSLVVISGKNAKKGKKHVVVHNFSNVFEGDIVKDMPQLWSIDNNLFVE